MLEFTYAVVGGGIAGVSCVEQILEFDPEARILLISSSSVVKEATNVTRLTKTLQDFVLVEKSLKSFKDVHQTVHVLHDHVATLDSTSHILTTDSGEQFKYKKICICTGARPNIVFPDSKFVVGIRDTESVRELATRIKDCKRLLLIGNGGIATEFVHEVDGVELLWAVKDKHISANYVDSGAAEFFIQAKLCQEENEVNQIPKETKLKLGEDVIKRKRYTLSAPDLDSKLEGVSDPGSALGPDWHRNVNLLGLKDKKNVTILYETEVIKVITSSSDIEPEKIEEGEETWPIYVEFTNGKVVGVDLIISATGVQPNCEWAKDCKQDASKGIFVDTAMRSSAPDVFAAGDVCFPSWKWAKHWFQMRLWTQARQMGLYAGKSMYLSYCKDLQEGNNNNSSEDEIELDFCFEIFSHVTKFFSFKVVLLGLYNCQGLDPSKVELIIRCTKGLEYVKVVLEGGRMQGALLIGETGLEETFENLILNQVDLTPYGEDLLNPDIDIEDYFD